MANPSIVHQNDFHYNCYRRLLIWAEAKKKIGIIYRGRDNAFEQIASIDMEVFNLDLFPTIK